MDFATLWWQCGSLPALDKDHASVTCVSVGQELQGMLKHTCQGITTLESVTCVNV